jgi:hypothetical protein
VPFLVAWYPLCWLLVRVVGPRGTGDPTTVRLLRAGLLAVGAAGVAGAAAVAVVAVADAIAVRVPAVRRTARWGRVADPPTGTLRVAGLVTLGLASYVVASSLVALPGWVDGPARVAGLLLGWPLAVTTLVTTAVGNAIPAVRASFGLRLLASLAGAALTACWILFVSDRIAAVVARRTPE